MPLYDYRCESCGHDFEAVRSIHDNTASHIPCPACQSLARRIVTRFPGVAHPMVRETHFNPTVGRAVSNDADFKSALSELSDTMTERTGILHSFSPIDHREARDHLGVTDEGLDSTYNLHVAQGKRDAKRYV